MLATPSNPDFRRCWFGIVARAHQKIFSDAFRITVVGVGMLLVSPAIAQQPVTSESEAAAEQIKQLIVQLSDDSFTVRQAAADQLLATGLDAREQLVAVVDGPDPETRAAASRLLTLIEKFEFKRQLEAFAADTDGQQGIKLPGWDQFRALIGDDAISRATFVEMQRHEGALLADVFGGRNRQPEREWEERLMRLVRWQSTPANRNAAPPLGSCATVLFLGCVKELNIADRLAGYQAHLVQRTPIVEAIKLDGAREGIRRVVVAWILNCSNRNEQLLQVRLTLARGQGIKEAIPMALQIAHAGPDYLTVKPPIRAAAVLLVGQLGTPDLAAQLEPLLEDDTVCMQMGQMPQGQPMMLQMRDVALIAMLHLTGQDPATYGFFDARKPGAQPTDNMAILILPNDEARDAAAAKWQTWKAAQSEDSTKETNPSNQLPDR